MIRLRLALELDYDIAAPGCDFIFNIHAAHTERQRVVDESLTLSQNLLSRIETDPITHNRCLRLSACPGPLKVSYNATVDLEHHFGQPGLIGEVPVARLPAPVLSYIYPSRYCQSDRLHKLAMREFGQQWQGYSRVQGIRDWVRQRTTFASNTSNSNTSAVDTLLETVGVCRDFAHLMIALCRAINIPARSRLASTTAPTLRSGRPTSTPMSRSTSATAGTCSIRRAPQSRWASCASAPGATRPTWRLRPSSAPSRRRRRASRSRQCPAPMGGC